MYYAHTHFTSEVYEDVFLYSLFGVNLLLFYTKISMVLE